MGPGIDFDPIDLEVLDLLTDPLIPEPGELLYLTKPFKKVGDPDGTMEIGTPLLVLEKSARGGRLNDSDKWVKVNPYGFTNSCIYVFINNISRKKP